MIRYLTLAEYLWLAEQVTGVDAIVFAKASRSDLADSVSRAPRAGFGDEEFYPDIFDKAAVLVCRLTWNHPLIDGNKRAAWAALIMFVELNQGESWTGAWLRERVHFVGAAANPLWIPCGTYPAVSFPVIRSRRAMTINGWPVRSDYR